MRVEKIDLSRMRLDWHAKLIVAGVLINTFLFIFNVNSYFTLTTAGFQLRKPFLVLTSSFF